MTAVLELVEERAHGRPAGDIPAPRVAHAEPRRRYLSQETPWRVPPLLTSLVITIAGLLGAGACWYGASGEAYLRDQLPWLVGAISSGAVFGVGMVIWLIVGFRELRQGQRELFADLAVVYPRSAAAAAVTESPLDAAETLVTALNMSLAHRPECLLLRGKSVTVITEAEVAAWGLDRCRMCLT